MIARIDLALAALWRRGLFAADVGFVGFWLGVLDREDLHAVDDAFYRKRENYRSEEHNRRGLFPWEAEAVREHFADARRLLVVGAGGGREVVALAGMGYDVLGFECNSALVDAAQHILAGVRLPGSASIELLDRDQLPEPGDSLDGAIVGWSTYMLIPGRDRRVDFLRGLRTRLVDDGPLLISFFTRPANTARLRGIVRIANSIRRLRRGTPVEMGDELAPNFVHRFTLEEVEQELAEAGFRGVALAPEGPGPYESGYAVGRAALQSPLSSAYLP
jgi:hypothetical protein